MYRNVVNGKPIVKIFTVTKNETDLIEDFLLYNGKLVGFKNIVVIDNCSTCPIVLSIYKKYIKKGIEIVYEPNYEAGGQGLAYTTHMKRFRSKCSFLIGLDTDEFINVENVQLYPYLLGLPKNATKFKVSRYMSSIPDPCSPTYVDQSVVRPVANIHTFKLETAKPPKYFFRAADFLSTVNGCHQGRTTNNVSLDVSLTYVHFHNTGCRRSIERARGIICGYNYTDIDSSMSKQLEDLSKVKSNIGGHRVLEYSLFLSRVLCLNSMMSSGVWPKTPTQLYDISTDFPTVIGWKTKHVNNLVPFTENNKNLFDNFIMYDAPVPKNHVVSRNICDTIRGKNNVKTAIMLSGHFRNFKIRKDFWLNFVGKYRDHVDFYIHTWSESGERGKKEWIDIGGKSPELEDIRKIFNPVRMTVEDHGSLFDSFSFNCKDMTLYYANFPQLAKSSDFTRNIGSQLYSIYKCHQLVIKEGRKYDILFRLRADSILLNFDKVIYSNLDFVNRNVLVANGSSNHSHPGGGRGCMKCDKEFHTGRRIHVDHSNDICDVLYFGSPVVMGRVCSLFLHVKQLVRSFKAYNDSAVRSRDVRDSLVVYPDVTGVNKSKIYEAKIKCYYPERLIREFMKNEWIISDPLGLEPKIMYK